MTIPVFYLQATSPKNDGVLVFLSVTFAWLVIHVLRHPRCGVLECVLLGLVLGCAALTKTTAVLLLFPWCVLLGVGLLVRLRLAAIWRGALIAVVAAVLVAGHTSRNVSSFGHPFGPLADEDGGFGLGMERHDVAAIGSNALRNLALHAMLASDEDARAVERFIRDIHARLGWDPDDLRTTWRRSYFAQAGLDKEGNAPAPVHVVYFFVAAPILVVLLARRRGGMALVSWACVAVGFVLFVSMVKWNEWHTRLHAPIVAMAAIRHRRRVACIGLRWLQVVRRRGCVGAGGCRARVGRRHQYQSPPAGAHGRAEPAAERGSALALVPGVRGGQEGRRGARPPGARASLCACCRPRVQHHAARATGFGSVDIHRLQPAAG